MTCRLFIPWFALLLLAFAPFAHAGWPSDPTINVPIATATGTQQTPKSCSDGAGGAIIAWFDYRSGNADIYTQRISRDGVPMWTTDGVAICVSSGSQSWCEICADGAGGAIIAWQDNRSGNYDIYVQRVHANGVPQWTANGVAVCTATDGQQGVQICSDGAFGAILSWRDYRNGTDNNIYARRINSSGVLQWTTNGVAICTATSEQANQRMVPDGAGGAIIAWNDYRSGSNYDVYAQRVNSSGTVQWTANGIVLCDAAQTQWYMDLAGDGAGGAVATWADYRSGTDYDIYAQRVSGAGTTQWTTDGVIVCTYSNAQTYPSIAADGQGGVVIAWQDERTDTEGNVYVQRLRADGHPQWSSSGVSLCTATGAQAGRLVVSDGAGGAIVTWADYRTGGAYIYARRVSAAGSAMWASNGVALCTNDDSDAGLCVTPDDEGGAIVGFGSVHGTSSYNIYAQRVDRFGAIGEAEPVLTAVSDVASDQGGQVVLEWTASYLDADPVFDIADYSVWRQVPSAAVAAEPAALAAAAGGLRSVFRSTTHGALTTYWEYVGSVPARAREGYSMVVATTTDSTAESNPFTRFMVSAENGGSYYWDSAPDSGYSVDNLAPPTPSPFTGTYADGASALQWGVCPAADFAVFRLYRGHSADFVPDAENLLATLTTCSYADDLGYPAWYKLCAVDVHGNASPCAGLLPNGAVDAPETALPRELALSPPAPFRFFPVPISARRRRARRPSCSRRGSSPPRGTSSTPSSRPTARSFISPSAALPAVGPSW
jgi:hypothetical protein